MLYILYKIGEFLALTLPIGIAYKIADIAGSLYYLLARRDRKIVNNNIKVVLNCLGNQKSIPQISRKVFASFARYLVEFFRTSKVDSNYIKRHIKFEGLEHLDKALGLGKGVVLLSAHLGNWELAGSTLSILGYKINIVAYTHKNKLINEFFVQKRESKGVKIIPLGAGIRKAFSVFKKNEILGVLGDVDYANAQTGIKAKFFGQETIMPKGPALFSLVSKAPIVPTALFREKENGFRFVFGEPIIYKSTGNRQHDLSCLTQQATEAIQKYISLHPEQWFMITPRWRQGA